ncbi:MAG: hypothetical protein PHE55_23290, partial [Methylococcaceae bacterium]|nr:hypothetical protein [Methylococcaceae bacterium]
SLALFLVLRAGYGALSSLVVGYPLIIAASALWFRVRFVWFITLLSLLSYGMLVIDLYCWHPLLQEKAYAGADRHVVFALAIILMGAIIGYLVRRVRTLSSFYGRPL